MAAAAEESDAHTDIGAWTSTGNLEELKKQCKPALEKFGAAAQQDDEWNLSRWLIARKGDTEAAAKMIRRHVKWRQDDCAPWYPDSLPPLEPVTASIATGKARFAGSIEATNAPLIYIDVEKHDYYAIDEEETRSFVICMIEHAIAKSYMDGGDGYVSAVFDVKGLGWNSADTGAVRFISLMLAANYPERLQTLFIVNEGVLFWGLWAVAKAFMDQRTLDKVKMLGDTDRDALIEAMGGEGKLLSSLGGTLEEEYDAEAATKQLLEIAEWHTKEAKCRADAGKIKKPEAGASSDDLADPPAAAAGGGSDD